MHLSRPELSDNERQNFYAMLDNLGAYVYCKDVNYNYTYVNKQVCELFERSPQEIVGANDCQLFDVETGRKMIEQTDSKVIEQGLRWSWKSGITSAIMMSTGITSPLKSRFMMMRACRLACSVSQWISAS
ncbi:PAS domain-containing protein [Aliamphritea spongicola]|nr:PAS domain-containing protein [Aliamphritea spongicola]